MMSGRGKEGERGGKEYENILILVLYYTYYQQVQPTRIHMIQIHMIYIHRNDN